MEIKTNLLKLLQSNEREGCLSAKDVADPVRWRFMLLIIKIALGKQIGTGEGLLSR